MTLPQTLSATATRLRGWLGQYSSAIALIAGLGITPQFASAEEATFLVQLNDYKGEGAYFSLYLVDPSDRYVRTLWVSGDDAEWHKDLPRWWKYLGRSPQKLDAISGASTKSGDRAVIRVELENDVLDAGYQVRVETAVEDLSNHSVDVEAPLEAELHGEKIEGVGYVRYLRYQW